MKKLLILTAILLAGFWGARAQDAVQAAADTTAVAEEPAPQYWKKFVTFDLGFNQTAL